MDLSTKIAVRLLPPSLKEDDFVATLPEDCRAFPRVFTPGYVLKRGIDARLAKTATAYFKFDGVEAAESFRRAYHGHTFIDEKGVSFRAVVTSSPNSKWQRLTPAKDPRAGTIADDAEWKTFLASGGNVGEEERARRQAKRDGDATVTDSRTPLVKEVERLKKEGKNKRSRARGGWTDEEWAKWEKDKGREKEKVKWKVKEKPKEEKEKSRKERKREKEKEKEKDKDKSSKEKSREREKERKKEKKDKGKSSEKREKKEKKSKEDKDKLIWRPKSTD